MAIHAEAVEILVTKGRFEPEVAIGIAEAIEVSMTLAQLVTVPVFDARVQDLKSEFHAFRHEMKAELERVKAELVRWVFLAMLGNVALSSGMAAVLKAFAN
jgi:hypothetical protein